MAMLNTVTDYNTRITLGKSRELEIIDFLTSKGMKIELPTAQQDMHDKIDGFFLPRKGGKVSFQLKQRESGDDVIFELVKDWDRNIEGRDMQSHADVYVVVDGTGKLYIIPTKEIKAKAKELLALADKNPIDQQGDSWQLKFTTDAAHHNTKVMCFFKPSMFTAIATYKISNYSH
jgi:hypothetical protein